MLKGQFKVTGEFIDVWHDWYVEQDKIEVFKEQVLAPYTSRRGAHVMKICMVLNACRTDDMTITAYDLQRSIDLLVRTERDMPKVFSGVGKSTHAEVLSKVMHEIGITGTISKTDLMKKFYFDADDRVMDQILDTLMAIKFINRKETAQGETILTYCRKEAY
jgi:hypothetical protein